MLPAPLPKAPLAAKGFTAFTGFSGSDHFGSGCELVRYVVGDGLCDEGQFGQADALGENADDLLETLGAAAEAWRTSPAGVTIT